MVIFLLVAIVILMAMGLGLYIRSLRSFDSYPNVIRRDPHTVSADHVKVGIIGDSWVAGRKLDHPIQEALSAFGLETEVVSSGHPGANSRKIYRNLLSSSANEYSSHHILMDEDIDYLVILAGINDTAGHIGKDFYAYHMIAIIKAAQSRSIFPVVVEVPEYGITEKRSPSLLAWAKSLLFRYLCKDNHTRDDIRKYRQELRSSAASFGIVDCAWVDFDLFVADYAKGKQYYVKPNYLNNDGNKQLGRLIAETIADVHNQRLERTRTTPGISVGSFGPSDVAVPATMQSVM